MANPAGGGANPPDLSSLQDNFSQQQAKITALKELVRQSEATQGRNNASAQEKVKNIAQRLTHLKTKASRARGGGVGEDKSFSELHEESVNRPAASSDDLDESHRSESLPVLNRARSETPGSEKIQLLRRQMEQNRAKMAEREHSKRDIEQLVTQLKAKFDSSQMSLDRSQQLGRSIGDLSASSSPHAHKYQSATDLSSNHNFDKDRIRYLEKRVADLEAETQRKESEFVNRDANQELQHRILDLQEQLREKDSLIEARTQAVGLLSENMSMRGKNTVDLLEDTQQEMHQMQTRFVEAEEAYRAEIDQKAMRIANLEEVNDILETARFDLTVQMAQNSGGESLDTRLVELQKMNENLQRKIVELEAARPDEQRSTSNDAKLVELQLENESLESRIVDLEAKLNELQSESIPSQLIELQKLNETLEKKIIELESNRPSDDYQIADLQQQLQQSQEANQNLVQQIESTNRRDQTTNTELTLEIEQLHVENDDLKRSLQTTSQPITNVDLTDRIRALEAELDELRNHNASLAATNESLDAELHEKTIDHNVLAANFSVLQEKLKSSAPKSLFSVSTDEEAEAEVAKLKGQLDEANKAAIKTKLKTKQLQKQIDALKKSSDLAAKVCQLTQENDALQQRNREIEKLAAQVNTVPSDTDLGKRIQVLETTCHNQISAIRLLEEQKIDISHDLSSAKEELHSLQDHCKTIDDHEETARVQSHMDSIEQEETIETALQTIVQLRADVAALHAERAALTQKLNDNVAENMELLERWDKLNKGSSAESIEIVEKLTPQETLEMEAMQRAFPTPNSAGCVIGPDLNDSLVQLREESNELMLKIEMFTKERCEVLDKMEVLSADNLRLTEQVEQLIQDKTKLEQDRSGRENKLQTELDTVQAERSELLGTIKELQSAKLELREELNIVTKCQAERSVEPIALQRDSYDKTIKSMEALLEGYRRGKDKNAKFDVSKKLAKEAKNLVELLTSLLTEHGLVVERFNALQLEASQATQIESLRDNVRTDRIETELMDAKQLIQNLETECLTRKEQVADLMLQIEQQAKAVDQVHDLNEAIDSLQSDLETIKNALEMKNAENERQLKQIEALEQDNLAEDILAENQRLKSELERQEQQIHILEEGNATINEQLLRQTSQHKHDSDGRLDAAEQERQILQALVDEQKAQLIQTITEHQQQLDNRDEFVNQLGDKMIALKQLFDSNNDLLEKQTIDLANNQETIRTLNAQIMELYRNTEQHESRLLEKDDEIGFLQEIIERNREEAIVLGNQAKALQAQIQELNQDVAEKQKTIRALDDKSVSVVDTTEKVNELQKIIDGLEARNKEQLDKLKKFAANLKKKNVQCTELTAKIDALESQISQPPLPVLATEDPVRIAELTDELKLKSSSIHQLTEQLISESFAKDTLQTTIDDLSLELQTNNAKIHSLNQQIQAAHQTIEERNAHLNDKDSHIKQLLETIDQRTSELSTLQHQQSEELSSQKLKIEKCKAIIREKNREIKRLQDATELHSEDPKFQELLNELNAIKQQKSADESTHQHQINALELKLQEHVNYIESLQTESQTLKEKISQLEEINGGSEERHQQLDQQLVQMQSQLAHSSTHFQQTKDEMQREITALLAAQSDAQHRIQTAQQQHQDLQDSLQEATRSASDGQHKFSALESQLAELQQRIVQSEDERTILIRDNAQLQSDLKQQSHEFEMKLTEKRDEVDTLENDLTIQLQRIEDERRRLHESLDKTNDQNGELQSDIVRFKEIITSLEQSNSDLEREMTWIKMQNEGMQQDQVEVQELRMQIVHDQTELENLKSQAQTMAQNHEAEVTALRQQLAELDSLRTQIGQNQTDDQMFIQNENERLQSLLASKEAEIQNYQRQNLQLQMTGAFGRPSTSQADPFASFSAPVQPLDDFARLTETSSDSEKLQRIEELESKLQRTIDELKHLKSQHDEFVQQTDAEKQRFEQASARHVEFQAAELADLRNQSELALAAKDDEIVQLREVIERIERESHAIEEPIVKSTATNQSHSQPDASTSQSDPETSSATVQELEQLRRNTSQLEQYINDLQIQLRIATNDCEQLTQMQQTLEDEIHQRSRGYEEKITSLRDQLKKRPVELSAIDSIESQIIPSSAAVPSFDGAMFFGQTTPSAFDLTADVAPSAAEPLQEIVEEVIVPKKAYQCVENEETIETTDDGWGFGNEEAALEEQHQQQSAPPTSLLTSHSAFQLQLQEQDDRIQELTLERDRLRTDNQALQVKSGKMLKKLKEYKSKNEELASASNQHFSKSPSVESNELDLAIQAELNNQIQALEARLAEFKINQEKDKSERQNLLKRIDVLTAANERLTEMKERQDADVDVLKNKVRQLSEQLSQLEQWGDDSSPTKATSSEISATPKELEELNRQIADLRVDNEELQAILNEEKENVSQLEFKLDQFKNAAASRDDVQADYETTLDQLSKQRNETARLTEEIAVKAKHIAELEQRNTQLTARMNESVATIDTLSVESNNIRLHLEQLKLDHQVKIDENSSLSQQLKAFSDHIKEMQHSMSEVPRSPSAGESDGLLEKQVEDLQSELQCKIAEIVHLNQTVKDTISQDQTTALVQEILLKNNEIEAQRNEIARMRDDIQEQEQRISVELSTQSTDGDERLRRLQTEVEELREDNKNMEQELAVLNDQVISSLKLEDQFEAMRLEMDRKSIEIDELRRSLSQSTPAAHPSNQETLDECTQRLNAHWEQVLNDRCAELADSWRQHMADRELEFESEKQKLNTDNPTQSTTTPSQTPNDAELQSLRNVLEGQELEIVTLKEQLAIRSAEYAQIAARVDPFGQMATANTSAAASKRDAEVRSHQKSELDLALYMLHQRDMRCEELTEELMAMLEERDSLQMKLSTSIRQLEQIRLGGGGVESTSSDTSPEKPVQSGDIQVPNEGHTTTPSSVPASARSISLRDERGQFQRQMAILQRDVATLPPEAVAELMGSDYTAASGGARSAIESSPSSVLLNWFWGKSSSDDR